MPDIINVTELSRIVLDFENRKYMINETDIGLYSGVKITFKNGRWKVQLKSKARFDRSGKATR